MSIYDMHPGIIKQMGSYISKGQWEAAILYRIAYRNNATIVELDDPRFIEGFAMLFKYIPLADPKAFDTSQKFTCTQDEVKAFYHRLAMHAYLLHPYCEDFNRYDWDNIKCKNAEIILSNALFNRALDIEITEGTRIKIEYSSCNDKNSCEYCKSMNGRIFYSKVELYELPFVNCTCKTGCRCKINVNLESI